ncbi:GNAT family N-acetyltransferase [Arenimonas fontis]|uniref:GNAT family N-acetyltransferase n=1 Tax=Arenimonas fontis TaxID=2608255 RepID=A0A5B2ZD26_9GAMM|nr:GNAT family N-acetyltransferase [Arenimonas fontis]KAA2284971.1 GNAT family N-acetyltransferase [Arenimonas fontis]
MSAVAIVPLADRPDCVPLLARWHHDEWAGLYEGAWTLEECESELRDHASRRHLPTTLVALEDGRPLGSVSLVREDAPEFRDLGDAWLASLYVLPAARGRGLGKRLVRELVALAAREGLPRLWLFTPEHEAFYAGLGWQRVGEASLHGRRVTLMDIRPQA